MSGYGDPDLPKGFQIKNKILKYIVLLASLTTYINAYDRYLCTIYSIADKHGETIMYNMKNEILFEDINNTAIAISDAFLMFIAQDKYQFTKIYNNYAGGIRYMSENYLIDIVDCTLLNNTKP